MNSQLILKFPSTNAYLAEDYYVSPSNQEAYDFINSWPKWIKRIANIYGPSGSGKTHLVSILAKRTSNLIIKSKELNDKIFFDFKTKEALTIEDVDIKIPENILFSIWNQALQDNKYLVFTSKEPISLLNFKLKDLKSRSKDIINLGLKLPSDDLISVILAKNFSDKQIKVEKNHIDYIVKRIDRSYEKISQFVLTLDKYSLEKGGSLSLKMIKEVLKMV